MTINIPPQTLTILHTLTPPLTFKNYPTLCSTLSLPILSGNSKLSQLKELSRYLSLQRVPNTNSLTITSIYPSPLPKQDNRGRTGNRSVYLPYTEPILSSHLISLCSSYGIDHTDLTKNELFQLFNLVNTNYISLCNRKIKPKQIYLSTNTKIPSFILTNFILITKSKLNSILSSCLNNMSNKNLITYSETLYGRKSYKQSSSYYKLTDAQINIVNNIKEQTLMDMRTSNTSPPPTIFSLIKQNKYETYNKTVNSRIKIELGYTYIFQKVLIDFPELLNTIDTNNDNNNTDADIITLKSKLNSLIISYLKHKFLSVVLSDKTIKPNKKDYYINCYNILIDYFINENPLESEIYNKEETFNISLQDTNQNKSNNLLGNDNLDDTDEFTGANYYDDTNDTDDTDDELNNLLKELVYGS